MSGIFAFPLGFPDCRRIQVSVSPAWKGRRRSRRPVNGVKYAKKGNQSEASKNRLNKKFPRIRIALRVVPKGGEDWVGNPIWWSGARLVYSNCSSIPLNESCSLVFYRFAFIVRYLLRYSPAGFFSEQFLLAKIAANFKPSGGQWAVDCELFWGEET